MTVGILVGGAVAVTVTAVTVTVGALLLVAGTVTVVGLAVDGSAAVVLLAPGDVGDVVGAELGVATDVTVTVG